MSTEPLTPAVMRVLKKKEEDDFFMDDEGLVATNAPACDMSAVAHKNLPLMLARGATAVDNASPMIAENHLRNKNVRSRLPRNIANIVIDQQYTRKLNK